MTDARSSSTRLGGAVGRVYFQASEPVTVLAQWRQPRLNQDTVVAACANCAVLHELPPGCRGYWHACVKPMAYTHRPRGKSPRNVLIRRSDGSLVVRPFRGLRKTASITRVVAVSSPSADPSEPNIGATDG